MSDPRSVGRIQPQPYEVDEGMKFHPDVLAAHAEFGGDLEDMQRKYETNAGKELAEKFWGVRLAPAERRASTPVREALERLEQFISAESADGNSDTIVSLRFLREIASALALATLSLPAGGVAVSDARRAGMNEAAAMLDEQAQEYNRIRDPGMANHCRAFAKRIREAALSPEAKTGER